MTATATAISSLRVSLTYIPAGSSALGGVLLNGPAPTGGAKVTLTSNNSGVVHVPASVTVLAGATMAYFTITTSTVPSDTSVLLAASYNNTVAGYRVTVQAPVKPPSGSPVTVTVSPATASIYSGTRQQFTVAVSGTSNTAVSWTATAGSISSAGLFTAPSVTSTTTVTVKATSQAAPTVSSSAKVTIVPVAAPPPPPPPGGGSYSGSGAISSWKAYQYLGSDKLYHQAIEISNASGAYPVIGYSYWDSACSDLGDTFNDFWQPIGNGIWWFIHQPQLVYVKWVWYNNSTEKKVLQQTPCIDYSGAPKFN